MNWDQGGLTPRRQDARHEGTPIPLLGVLDALARIIHGGLEAGLIGVAWAEGGVLW